MNYQSITEYRHQIKRNIDVVNQLSDSGSETAALYPSLSHRLRNYTGSLAGKLLALLEYAAGYGLKTEKQFISRDLYRGYEAALSYDMMVQLYGGAKRSWLQAVGFFSSVGLLYVHKPDQHSSEYNTPAQAYSVQRAKAQNHRHGVNWYSYPAYTEAILSEAEKRCKALQGVGIGSITKDTIRDILGAKEANRAHDTGYNISAETQTYRDILKTIMLNQIDAAGYTTPARILAEAYDIVAGEDQTEDQIEGDIFEDQTQDDANRIKYRILKTWRAYRHQLMTETGRRYAAPTAEEIDKYCLAGKTWIIR